MANRRRSFPKLPPMMIRIISCLLILLPAVLGFLYVRSFGVDVVRNDQWGIVDLFDKLSSGTLSISDLFSQHNEHRILFPRIVMLSLGTATEYSNVAEMYLVQACFWITLVCLLLAFRSTIKSKFALFPLFMVPVSFLVFSLRQYENMLEGFQLTFVFAQTFGVLTLYLLYVSRREIPGKGAFLAALASGTVASFSTAQGLLVWPAGLLQLLISPGGKPTKKRSIAIWGLVGLVEWIAYFWDYVEPAHPPGYPPFDYLLEYPAVGVESFLTLLGSSLFWQQSYAFAGGLLLAGLAVISLLLTRKSVGEYSFWIALLFFSFLVLSFIVLGRFGLGAEQMLQSRYASFSILIGVSLYAILVKLALERKSRVAVSLSGILLTSMLLSVFLSYPEGVEAGRRQEASREKLASVLLDYESQPDESLRKLYPDPELVRDKAPVLERLGYNVFSDR